MKDKIEALIAFADHKQKCAIMRHHRGEGRTSELPPCSCGYEKALQAYLEAQEDT